MLRILLLLSFCIPLIIISIYGIILFYYGILNNDEKQKINERNGNAKFEPFVSIVVPTHNEKMIISKKIESLLNLNYPTEKLEIIFVDDSNDSTPNIIEDYSKKFSNIHLIRYYERIGYSPSMIAGCKIAKGEIIVTSDAGSFLDRDAIKNLVKHFLISNIGVVTGNDIILNENEEVAKSENLYLKIINFLRKAETRMDSTFYIKGEATAVKKDLIKDLEACSETFDTTVGLFVRQKGYKIIYDPNVKFYEYAPLTHSDRVKQKTIRAANLIKVIFRYKHMMFKRKNGKYGFIILPMNFAMLTVVPLMILMGGILLIILPFFDFVFSTIIWSIIGIVIIFLLILSRHFIFTFFEFEYSLLKAIYQVIFAKKTHDKIEKIISTRR